MVDDAVWFTQEQGDLTQPYKYKLVPIKRVTRKTKDSEGARSEVSPIKEGAD